MQKVQIIKVQILRRLILSVTLIEFDSALSTYSNKIC